MNATQRPAGIAVGAWVRFAGQVGAVVGVTVKAAVLTDTGGGRVEVPVAELTGDPDFAVVDERVVAAMRAAISEGVDASTRTGSYLIWRTGEILRRTPETQGVELPSQRTLYRLPAKLTRGTHTFGAASTRRSRPTGRGPRSESCRRSRRAR